jgi:hypothetical protein
MALAENPVLSLAPPVCYHNIGFRTRQFIYRLSSIMSRYVILQHETADGRHWDFLVESGDKLKGWALAVPPSLGVEVECDARPDHRSMYLDYEGPISDNRGEVARWDRGEYEALRRDDDYWELALRGEKLRGVAVIRRAPGSPPRWFFKVEKGDITDYGKPGKEYQ